MKSLKIYGMVLLILVMMFGITGCDFITGDDDDDFVDGTISVNIVGQTEFANSTVYFAVTDVGGDHNNPADIIATGSFDLVNGSGSGTAQDGEDDYIFPAGNYEIHAFVDMDGSGSTGPNACDYEIDSVVTESASSKDLKVSDFNPPDEGTITFTLTGATTYATDELYFVVMTSGDDPASDLPLAVGYFVLDANGDGSLVAKDEATGLNTIYIFDSSTSYDVYAVIDINGSGDDPDNGDYVTDAIVVQGGYSTASAIESDFHAWTP